MTDQPTTQMGPQPYRIKAEWDKFVGKVYPVIQNGGLDPKSIQYQELRRTFYAGYRSMLFVMMRDLSPGPEDDNPQDEWLMQHLENELDEFLTLVLVGAA